MEIFLKKKKKKKNKNVLIEKYKNKTKSQREGKKRTRGRKDNADQPWQSHKGTEKTQAHHYLNVGKDNFDYHVKFALMCMIHTLVAETKELVCYVDSSHESNNWRGKTIPCLT